MINKKACYIIQISVIVLFFHLTVLRAEQDPHWIPPEKETLTQILNDIYNFEFDSAEHSIAAYKNKYPWRPEGSFAEGMVLWTQVLADLYNPALDSMFFAKMDEIIDAFDKIADKDSLYTVTKYYKSAAMGFKARLYVNRSQWFKAALSGVKALSGILDALDGEYPNTDAKLGTGIYLYYAEMVPEKYPIAKPLLIFYPSGNKEKGLADLQEASKNGLFARIEASYIYAQTLYLYERKFYNAFRIMKKLHKDYPNNSIFLRWYAALAYSIGEYTIAHNCLDTYESRIAEKQRFYLTYHQRFISYRRGLILQKQKKWQEALASYNEALKILPEKIEKEMTHYRVLSKLNRAYCLRRLKKYDEAIEGYRDVLEEPDIDGSRDKAKKLIKRVEKRLKKSSR